MNLLNVRTSKVNNSTLEDFSYFVGEIVESDVNNSRFKGRGVFSIFSTIKILDALKQDRSFSDLYLVSGFGMKRAFLNYLNFLAHFGFIQKASVGANVYYHITAKGKNFLDLFRI